MTSAKEYKRNFEKKSIAWKAKNAVRRAVNPTPAEMREKTAKLREANLKKEERVRALEESRKARVKAQRLREREAAARRPIPVKQSSSGRSYAGRVMSAFDSPLYGGSGGGVDFSKFGTINQNPYGGSSSKSAKASKSYDPFDFFYR